MRNTLLIIDEAQASYQYGNLWTQFIKRISSDGDNGRRVILFSSYGYRLRYLLYVVLSNHLQLSSLLTNHQVFTPSQIQSQKAQIEKMCEYDFQKDTDTKALLVSGSK